MQLRKRRQQVSLVILSLAMILSYQNCAPGFEVKGVKQGSLENDSSLPAPNSTPPQNSDPTPTPDPVATPLPVNEPEPEVPPVIPPSMPTNPTPTPTPTPAGTKMVFMAMGHVARTLVSCDGGRSWIKDRSDNDNTRCWVSGNPNYVECDHTPTSAVAGSLDAGDGWFIAGWGWGYDGTVRRTRDGTNWQTIRVGSGGGALYYGGRMASLYGSWFGSNDLGMNWSPLNAQISSQLAHPLARRVGDNFIATSRQVGNAVSRDFGMTWQSVPSFRPEWGNNFEEGNGVIVSAGSQHIAYSTDDGRTWTGSQVITSGNLAGLVFNGTHFVTWTEGQRWTSTDGINWTRTPITISGALRGPIAYNPETRTYTAIPNEWGQYYANQRAYFSADGLTWTQLSSTQFRGGIRSTA